MATTAKDKDEKKRNPTMLNRKARHEYVLEETYAAGMALTGTEVKSIRLGLANLQDSFCRVQNGEVWVYNLYIAPYEQGNRAKCRIAPPAQAAPAQMADHQNHDARQRARPVHHPDQAVLRERLR